MMNLKSVECHKVRIRNRIDAPEGGARVLTGFKAAVKQRDQRTQRPLLLVIHAFDKAHHVVVETDNRLPLREIVEDEIADLGQTLDARHDMAHVTTDTGRISLVLFFVRYKHVDPVLRDLVALQCGQGLFLEQLDASIRGHNNDPILHPLIVS